MLTSFSIWIIYFTLLFLLAFFLFWIFLILIIPAFVNLFILFHQMSYGFLNNSILGIYFHTYSYPSRHPRAVSPRSLISKRFHLQLLYIHFRNLLFYSNWSPALGHALIFYLGPNPYFYSHIHIFFTIYPFFSSLVSLNPVLISSYPFIFHSLRPPDFSSFWNVI